MFIVFYPTSGIFERHSFDGYDNTDNEHAKKIFKKLHDEFCGCDDFGYFDCSTTDHSSRFSTIEDFAEDINNENYFIENCWSIVLNLSEKDVMDIVFADDELQKRGNGVEYHYITKEKTILLNDDGDVYADWNENEAKIMVADYDDIIDYISIDYKPAKVGFVALVYNSKSELLGAFNYVEENYTRMLENFIADKF